jgi:hypothetical protein
MHKVALCCGNLAPALDLYWPLLALLTLCLAHPLLGGALLQRCTVDLYHGLYSLGHAVLWLRMHHLENIIPTTLSYDGATVAHSQTDYSAFLAPRRVILTTMVSSKTLLYVPNSPRGTQPFLKILILFYPRLTQLPRKPFPQTFLVSTPKLCSLFKHSTACVIYSREGAFTMFRHLIVSYTDTDIYMESYSGQY